MHVIRCVRPHADLLLLCCRSCLAWQLVVVCIGLSEAVRTASNIRDTSTWADATISNDDSAMVTTVVSHRVPDAQCVSLGCLKVKENCVRQLFDVRSTGGLHTVRLNCMP
jgi:hypothetical protein